MTKKNKKPQLDTKGQQTLLAILTSKTYTAAAEKLSIDRGTLYQRIDKYHLREQIEKVPQQALENLMLASLSATDTLIDGLTDRKEKYNNAKDILDRVGVGVKQGPAVAVQVNNSLDLGKYMRDVKED